jgi:hypothetical protein
MKIYMIRDQDDNPVETYKKTWCYKTLGIAKTSAKNIIRHKNKKLDKNSRIDFEHFKIIEYEIIVKDTHPI